jgi:hypothetical protein
MPSKAKQVYVTCSCGWTGKRRRKSCEDDRCGEGGYCYGWCGWGRCKKCGGSGLDTPAEHRAQQQRWKEIEEWWEREGKYLYGTTPSVPPEPEKESVCVLT